MDNMNKTKLLDTLREKRAQWDAVLAQVPEAVMTEPGVAGEWSVKDIVAHLNSFERWYADRLHEALRGEVYTPTEFDWIPFDERNDRVFRQNRQRPLADVLAESWQAFARLLEGVQAQSEAFLIEPQLFPGAPEPLTVWKMLRGDVYDHYGEHISSIESWLAARPTASDDVARLFAGYERAFDALDVEAIVGLYGDCCIAAAPHFVACTKGAEELRAAVTQAFATYRQIGMVSARLVSLAETALDDYYSLAKVRWGARFQKTGDELITFEDTYLVHRDGPALKIILFISHADEQAVMREKGLIAE
jgi:hypothetical protein